jgi:hypothetical protein
MITRENYLQTSIAWLSKHLFEVNGYTVPQVKVSTGLPGGRGGKKAIGQHWSPQASTDQVGSIFISPTIDDTHQVLAVLVHELVHAVVGNEFKHGAVFSKCAKAVGLEGKMTCTTAGEYLTRSLKSLVEAHGTYPHSRLNLADSPIKKQTTRMVKMECPECGYIARTSQKNIEEHGPVQCPCNNEPMEVV